MPIGPAAGVIADHLGGVVAAEGTFAVAQAAERRDGRTRPSFTFAVALGAVDTTTVELFRAYLGVGRIRTYARRKAHYDDEVVFAVRAFRDLVDVVVPFLDGHLPPSYKSTQYETWRAQLLAYDAERASWAGWSRRRREGEELA